jgi:hypothetical protein
MHIENELVEFMTAEKQEYDEVIEEYEDEVLVHEEFPEPLVTDAADTAPAQDKPRCITRILIITIYIYIYICVCVCVCVCCAFTLQEFYDNRFA